MIDNLFIQNPSIFAIQLSVLSGLFVWLFFRIGSKWRYVFLTFAVILIGYEFFLEGRAAMIGSLSSVLFCAYPALKNNYKIKNTILLSAAVILFSIAILAVFYKAESSKGRMFIWKQSLELLEKNWAWGVGWGRFNPAINHQQAVFFEKESLYTTSAKNADNCYFAFNEWLHIAVELGIAGLLMALVVTIFLLTQCFKNINTKTAWMGATLLPVFVASLFSYPLHNIYILACFTLISCLIAARFFVQTKRIAQSIVFLFFGLMAISLVLLPGARYLRYKKQYSEFNSLLTEGRRTEAYQAGTKIKDYGKQSHAFCSVYLKLLFDTHRIPETIEWFEISHACHCSNEVHTIIGKCYDEMGDSANAEKHFLTSLFIKPHLLQSRIDLMNFYSSHGNERKAVYWASEVLKYPIKVKNIKAEMLRKEAQKKLLETNSDNSKRKSSYLH